MSFDIAGFGSTVYRGRMGQRPTALIAEDEIFIVLDVEEALREAGIEVAASVFSNAAALAWLANHQPDLAVVDYRLRDGISEALAQTLKARSIPFIVYSAQRFDPDITSPVFHGSLWLDKPAESGKLVPSILNLLAACVPSP